MVNRIPKLFLAGLATFILSTSYMAAQRGADPEARFRDAQRKGDVEGDLNGAMEIYREIAASPAANHALKARALLQLAGALETLGQQAEATYERIIKEFPDEPAVSTATKRLAALKATDIPPMTLTLVKFGPGIQNVVATDGRRVVYWDDSRTTLFIADANGKAKAQVFAARPDRRPRVEVSRDLSRVFLYFDPTGNKAVFSYAVIQTDGSAAYREIDLPASWNGGQLPLFGVNWSFDNRYVLLCKMGEDRFIHALRLSIDSGQMTDLTPGQRINVTHALISPDGHSLALDDRNGAVYIMPTQGGALEKLTDDGAVADWTLDGRTLVFGAVEKQVFSLFTLPVSDGKSAGTRTFVRGIGAERFSRPITSGTSLIFFQAVTNSRGPQVHYASLDADGRLSDWTALRLIGTALHTPQSSPDGKQITYRAPARGLRIHTLATGEDHELYLGQGALSGCLWASQTPVVYCGQRRAAEDQTGILRIDVATGRAETVMSFSGTRILLSLSPDDRIIQMRNPLGPTPAPQWEIGSDHEIPGPVKDPGFLSPDGRWALTAAGDSSNRREYQVRAVSAGNEGWEHLVYLRKQQAAGGSPLPVVFSGDGNWIFYHDIDASGENALFRVSTSGGEPLRLGDYPTSLPSSYLALSRDGQRFFVEVLPDPQAPEGRELEAWILQNFLPPVAVAKP